MTKKYPSQKKYEAENPTITIRLKKREKEQIKEMSEISETSVSDLVRMSLLDQVQDFSKAIAEAENRGYEKGKEDWGLWHYCDVCDEGIYIQPNTDAHKAIIEYMKAYGWGHPGCHKQQ